MVRAQNRLIPGSAMRIRTSGDGRERYTWLAAGLPSTLRKIDYGVSGGPYQPTSSSLLANLDKPWDWKVLEPGSYRVVVLGLEGIGTNSTDDWPSLLEHNLACAAMARLTINF
jgi:hypothetical protein